MNKLPAWAEILICLNKCNGIASRKMITEITQLNYITVCQVVARLKDQGSVSESKRMLSLTPAGSEIAEKYLPAKEDMPASPAAQVVDDVMPPGAV